MHPKGQWIVPSKVIDLNDIPFSPKAHKNHILIISYQCKQLILQRELRVYPVSMLHLTVKNKPFEVMVTGEKNQEYRKPSQWIDSRLIKYYDFVKIVNGYGGDKPMFIAEYFGFSFAGRIENKTYSNGLEVEIEAGDRIIELGEVVFKDNLKQPCP